MSGSAHRLRTGGSPFGINNVVRHTVIILAEKNAEFISNYGCNLFVLLHVGIWTFMAK